MSRTHRRRRATHLSHQYIDSQVDRQGQVDPFWVDWHHCHSAEEWLACRRAWFHGDSHPGRWSPPSGFVRQFNRRYRFRARDNLRRAKVHEAWDGFTDEPFIKGAGWEWF